MSKFVELLPCDLNHCDYFDFAKSYSIIWTVRDVICGLTGAGRHKATGAEYKNGQIFI